MNQIKLSTRVWQDPLYFIGFGFGSGLLPFAPGTWGTLAAIPLYYLMNNMHWAVYLALIVFFFIVGVKASDKISTDLGVHDYKGIVWDEVVGYLLTMFLVPRSWPWVCAGFVLFRIFDILKPFPISWIDKKVHGGLGIMLDDVLAALPAWAILYVVSRSMVL